MKDSNPLKLVKIFCVLFMALLFCLLPSCKKDIEQDKSMDEMILGTWKLQMIDYSDGNIFDYENDNITMAVESDVIDPYIEDDDQEDLFYRYEIVGDSVLLFYLLGGEFGVVDSYRNIESLTTDKMVLSYTTIFEVDGQSIIENSDEMVTMYYIKE